MDVPEETKWPARASARDLEAWQQYLVDSAIMIVADHELPSSMAATYCWVCQRCGCAAAHCPQAPPRAARAGSAEPPRQRRKATRSWTPEEDAILRQAIHSSSHGDWGAVSELVPDRNSKQCRERWLNHLAPGISKVGSLFLSHSPFPSHAPFLSRQVDGGGGGHTGHGVAASRQPVVRHRETAARAQRQLCQEPLAQPQPHQAAQIGGAPCSAGRRRSRALRPAADKTGRRNSHRNTSSLRRRVAGPGDSQGVGLPAAAHTDTASLRWRTEQQRSDSRVELLLRAPVAAAVFV